jgi:hypothetical protein
MHEHDCEAPVTKQEIVSAFHMMSLTWLRIGENEWDFGIPVRGVIREVLASVYFDEERNPGWIWLLGHERVACNYFRDAVAAAEKALGVS